MSKRRRIDTSVVQRPVRLTKRPIDKQLLWVEKSAFGTTKVSTNLYVPTVPCTITGLRWALNFKNLLTTGSIQYIWMIHVLRGGSSTPEISQSDGSNIAGDEREVMAWGVGILADADIGAGPQVMKDEGSTKTMRKMMPGDILEIVFDCDTASGADVAGIVQFFAKF